LAQLHDELVAEGADGSKYLPELQSRADSRPEWLTVIAATSCSTAGASARWAGAELRLRDYRGRDRRRWRPRARLRAIKVSSRRVA